MFNLGSNILIIFCGDIIIKVYLYLKFCLILVHAASSNESLLSKYFVQMIKFLYLPYMFICVHKKVYKFIFIAYMFIHYES